MKPLIGLFLLSMAILPVGAETPPVPAPPRVIDTVIGGAPCQIAFPEEPTGNLLLYVHGHRPESAPLKAALDLDGTAHSELIANGWMVAMSAFGRNGVVIRDAMDDIVRLRAFIEEAHGPLALVILEGRSMGGTIVTHLAETRPDLFNGALAIGAALDLVDAEDPLPLTGKPKMPILFLANRSEIDGSSAYVGAAAEAPVPPVLWRIERDGHVNVNEEERFLAIDGLINWITAGSIDAGRAITIEVDPAATRALSGDSGATARVIDVTGVYGNLHLDLATADFDQLGIRKGDDFLLTVGTSVVKVRYGTTFGDVPTGNWISFPTAVGTTIVAINYGNASEVLGVAVGDAARVEVIRPAAE